MGSPKRVRSWLQAQMAPEGKTRGRCRIQARDSEDLDRLSIISGELANLQLREWKMTLKSVLSYRSVLAGVLVLITACGPVRPPPSFGVATSQPTQVPNVPLTLASGPPTTPIPTSVFVAVPIATAPMPQASPTVPTVEAAPLHPTEAAPSPLPDLADTPQPTPSPTIPPPAFPPTISLKPVLSGFRAPVYVTHAGQDPSGSARLLVVEKEGRIHLIENGNLLPTPLLGITDRVGSENNEQGLLSAPSLPTSLPAGSFT
jgi:hypothetical protein